MSKHNISGMILNLFEGEGGGAAATGTGEAGGNAAAVSAGKKTGAYDNVRFGKQTAAAESITTNAQDSSPAAGESGKGDRTVTSSTQEDRLKAYRDFVNSADYKEVHTQEIQRIINGRFKETEALKRSADEAKPLLDMIYQRYGVKPGDIKGAMTALDNDNSYWEAAAEEAGMTVESFKELQKYKREHEELVEKERRQKGQQAAEAQLQKWYAEAEELKKQFPDFSLDEEAKNKEFVSLLRAGLPMVQAFRVIHLDELMNSAVASTATATEKRVVDGIRAKGQRPTENGTTSQSAFTVKDDVSKLSKADRAEIARRAARGEIISF